MKTLIFALITLFAFQVTAKDVCVNETEAEFTDSLNKFFNMPKGSQGSFSLPLVNNPKSEKDLIRVVAEGRKVEANNSKESCIMITYNRSGVKDGAKICCSLENTLSPENNPFNMNETELGAQ
jgi:hypothetical protein